MAQDTATDIPLEAREAHWGWTLALGFLALVGGLAGFLNPFAATLTAELLVAGFALALGVMQIGLAVRQMRNRWWNAFGGVLFILFALSLLLNPLAGLVSLTIFAASFFVASGAARIWLALRSRPAQGWGWMLLSGAVSIALAGVVFWNLPSAALTLLGLLLAIDLTMFGAALVAAALAQRRA